MCENGKISLFSGDFSLNFLVAWSKFVHLVDFDIVYALNIDLLRYNTTELRNRGSNSQNQANANSVSSRSTLFIVHVYVWNAFDFYGEIKNDRCLLLIRMSKMV